MSSPVFKSPRNHNAKIRVSSLLLILLCTAPILIFIYGHHERDKLLNRNRIFTETPPITTADLRTIWMAPREIKLLLKYLTRDVTNYLEWGSGGSTLHFPRYVSGRYVSIEHDNAWCAKMKARLLFPASTVELSVARARKKVELRCIRVNRGSGGWGIKSRFEEGTYPVFKKYIDGIAEVSKVSDGSYSSYLYWDFVLIDGRCRVDAAIKALSFIRNNSIVALHDSHRLRKHYGDVHKYYDVVEEYIPEGARGLAILKRKKKFARLEGHPELTQRIIDLKYNL